MVSLNSTPNWYPVQMSQRCWRIIGLSLAEYNENILLSSELFELVEQVTMDIQKRKLQKSSLDSSDSDISFQYLGKAAERCLMRLFLHSC